MRERVRAFLGVWAPMILGVLVIALAVSYLLAPPAQGENPIFAVDPLASAACGLLLVAVGGIMIASTYGRWRKARLARRT